MTFLSLGLFPSKCGEHGPVQGGEIVFVKCSAKGLILRDLAVTMIVNDYTIECCLGAGDSGIWKMYTVDP